MSVARILIVLSLFCPGAWSATSADLIGTWEGESKCTAPESPCHDEHVRYQIHGDKKDPAKLNILGYKVVNGTAEYMGTLECEYYDSRSTLTCTGHSAKQDDWEFHVSGDSMTGTLKIGPDRALYRRIKVLRVLSKE